MTDIYQILKNLNINYKKHEHPPVFTCDEAEKYCAQIKGGKSKNLFLRNKKGDKHYLVVLDSQKNLDIKQLTNILNENRLSFASPKRLKKYLKLTPGAVSPFGLINDVNKEVEVIIDEDLMSNNYLQFHPNINNATLVISKIYFQKFLDWTGNNFNIMKL